MRGGGRVRRAAVAVVGGALVAGAVAYALTARGAASPAAATASAPLASVVVAASDLAPSTKLSATNLRVIQEPADRSLLPSDYFSSPTQVYGQYLAIRVAANAPILASMLISTPADAQNSTVSAPPLDIPAGDVAMSIPYDPQRGVGGYVQAGDHIDILVSVDGANHYGFQDVPVLRVGSPGTGGASAGVLVVVLPRDRAAALAFIVNDHSGRVAVIGYLLRPHESYGKGDLGNSDPIDTGNLGEHLDG